VIDKGSAETGEAIGFNAGGWALRRSAELCGQLHFKMKSYMLVLPEDELQALNALPQDKFQARMKELLDKYQLPSSY